MSRKKLYIPLLLAAVLWFFMFSPWTKGVLNFWICMLLATTTLVIVAQCMLGRENPLLVISKSIKDNLWQILVGVCSALTLWGIFWVGNKLSQLWFDFARPQVDVVYAMKNGHSSTLIACLLLFCIGPCEELFWRGYVQRVFSKHFTRETGLFCRENCAFIVTTIFYALVHIWSFNFMLVMAALVAGAFWGLLYRLRPSWLLSIVISHALWDALVFVIMPI